mmetsp:Transcript_6846/g.11384  ORF Transcript_6846/g.11384 Transcript_6846/m.11384 type:complete len:526 (-) Transcript_6846:735-2312(-)
MSANAAKSMENAGKKRSREEAKVDDDMSAGSPRKSSSSGENENNISFVFQKARGKKIKGRALAADGTEIGNLNGFLIDRSVVKKQFYQTVNKLNEEMLQLGTLFFTSNGQLTASTKELLGCDSSCDKGGLINIEKIELIPSQRGNELSILFLKECLEFFKNSWTVCIIEPAPWRADGVRNFADGRLKLSAMYARLGFTQLGRHAPEVKYWGLSSNNFSGMVLNKEDLNLDIAVLKRVRDKTSGEKLLGIVIKMAVDKHQYIRSLQPSQACASMNEGCREMLSLLDARTELVNAKIDETISKLPEAVQQHECIDSVRSEIRSKFTGELEKLRAGVDSVLRACNSTDRYDENYREDVQRALNDGSQATIDSANGLQIAVGKALFNQLNEKGMMIRPEDTIRGDLTNAFLKAILPLCQEHGAHINNGDEEAGRTALHVAATGMSLEMCQLLIAAGADVNVKSHRGFTPLDECRCKAEENGIVLLLNPQFENILGPCAVPKELEDLLAGVTQPPPLDVITIKEEPSIDV